MLAYWDTSALLGLIYQEPRSREALDARNQTTKIYSWWWTQIEANAALLRRGATHQQKTFLQSCLEQFSWLEVPQERSLSLKQFNLKHKLRAAEAGHLFCFQQASLVLPELVLVCFDGEMVKAARSENLTVWKPV